MYTGVTTPQLTYPTGIRLTADGWSEPSSNIPYIIALSRGRLHKADNIGIRFENQRRLWSLVLDMIIRVVHLHIAHLNSMTHLHRRGRPSHSLNEIATSVRYRTTNHNFIRLLLPLSHSRVVQSRLKYSNGWWETTMASPNQRFHVIITFNSICEYHLLIYRVVSFHKSNAHLLKVNNCRNYCFKKMNTKWSVRFIP